MPKTPEEIAAEEAAAKAAAEAETPEGKLAAAQAEVEKWKTLSRKNEDQAKSNADKAKKFDELEEANKTEQEKLLARAESAEKKLADRDAKDAAAATAAEVAKVKGVPVEALRGTTREELEAHADALAAILPKKPPAPSADGQGEGEKIGAGEMSADDIVTAATAR
ncbi:hypothetical protein [Microbacterium allomyrinae]|uniref:DUF4355 domain-containing protein n=1 Tax=Microbacterium allomyrinae TaxID=2830666 RepID=A0A9X1LTR6_9MICO|nr:hypothetical protein [Microbacterium allomyrinae]MCC2031824.1 hypothetical protein [Microbacterium allomyrinae]